MSLKPLVSMREALTDPQLLGGALPGPSWLTHRAMLIAAMGEALTDEERVAFTEVTQREREPLHPVRELWELIGRRSGKTRAAGTLGAYIGALCDHSGYLAPGERATIPVLASSTDQAERAFDHALGVLEHSPHLSGSILSKTNQVIRLDTRVEIKIRPANMRTIRGITAPAVIADEVAFWQIEGSSNPDTEVLNAARPALATTGGPLFVISSVHGKRGALYTAYQKHFGEGGHPRILVAKAPSLAFNPTLDQEAVELALDNDRAAAGAEYLSEFRNDVEAFVDRDQVEACVARGVLERPRADGVQYFGFVDPSGGGADSFTLAIGHREGEGAVVDVIRERRPPFSPEAVVEEYAALLKSYGIARATGDAYAGQWPREAFGRNGITYILAEAHKSALYQGLLPLLNSRRVLLPDMAKVVDQIALLERRVARGGRETIDHPPHGHDDVANVVAGVARLCVGKSFSSALETATYGPSSGFGEPNPLCGTYSYGR